VASGEGAGWGTLGVRVGVVAVWVRVGMVAKGGLGLLVGRLWHIRRLGETLAHSGSGCRNRFYFFSFTKHFLKKLNKL